MTNYDIRTQDGAYVFTAIHPGKTKFALQTNNKFSNTQGYLRKKQGGKNRVQAVTLIDCTRGALENTIAPMIVYPDEVTVIFDRNIPLRGTNTGNFVFEKYKITQGFDTDGGDSAQGELEITVTEVIDN